MHNINIIIIITIIIIIPEDVYRKNTKCIRRRRVSLSYDMGSGWVGMIDLHEVCSPCKKAREPTAGRV